MACRPAGSVFKCVSHPFTKEDLMPLIGFLVAASLFFVSAGVSAEPSRSPRFLMSQPLTVFDWGIIEMRRKLESFRTLTLFDMPYLGGSVDYLWDENLIVMLGKFQGQGTDRECANNLKLLKGGFADFEWDTQKQADAARAVLNQLFNHPAGYAGNGAPIDVGKNLVSIVRIEATVYVEKDGVLSVGARCSGEFQDAAIKVIK